MKRSAMALATVLATWFGCGLFPLGPGTVGSLAALAVAWGLHRALGWGPWSYGALAALMLAPAIWAAGAAARESGSEDPGIVVIDEVVGQWVTLVGATELNWKSWLAALVLFRAFDILKPFPLRKLETIEGGAGIVADDVGAGIYAALVLYAIGWMQLY